MPTYNLFGWQKPCYLLDEGYAKTFRELMREISTLLCYEVTRDLQLEMIPIETPMSAMDSPL